MIDYRKLRLNNLRSPEFSHLLLLLFWPIYGILFWLAETGFSGHGFYENYTPIYCPLDDMIPFCEIFVIPYYIWFAFIVGMLLYTMLFDAAAFRKMMWIVILTYTATIIIYYIFPNCQELRPDLESLGRDNIFIDIARNLYDFDTNTNVCPSIHVLGSMAVFMPSWNTKHMTSWWCRTIMFILNILICFSTVFLKQHSIIDVFASFALCAIVYPIIFWKKSPLNKKIMQKSAVHSKAEEATIAI